MPVKRPAGSRPDKNRSALSLETTIEEVPDDNGGFRIVKRKTVIKSAPADADDAFEWGSPEAAAYASELVNRLEENDRNL